MATTLTNITDRTYSYLNTTSSSNRYDLTWIQDLSNYYQRQVCRRYSFPFLFKQEFTASSIDTTVDTAVASGDATIVIADDDGLQASGYVLIEEEIIQYASVASDTLTLSSTAASAHAAGVTVKQIYAFPENSDSEDEVDNLTKIQVSGDEYAFYDFRTEASEKQSHWFTIRQDSSNNRFLELPSFTASAKITWDYLVKPRTMVADTVDATIPDDFAKEIIANYVAGHVKRKRNEEGRGAEFLADAEKLYIQMVRFYKRQSKPLELKIRNKYFNQGLNV